MTSILHHGYQRWTVLFIVLLNHTVAKPQHLVDLVEYDRFVAAWQKEDVVALDLLRIRLSEQRTAWFYELGLLVSACSKYRSDSTSECLEQLKELEVGLPEQQILLRSWIHRVRGKCYKRVRDLPKALKEIRMAVELLDGTEFREEFSSCLIIHAEVLRKLNDQEGALVLLERARTMAEGSDFSSSVCNGLINRGNIYYDQKRYKDAWRTYRQTVERSLHFGYENIAARAVMNLGAVAFMTDRYDLAAHLYDSIVQTLPQDRSVFRADLIRHSAHAYARLGSERLALVKFAEAMSLHKIHGDSAGIAKTLQLRSALKWNMGSHEEAIVDRERALALARDLKWTKVEKNSLFHLYEWYRNMGKYDDAFNAMEKYQTLSDSLTRTIFSRDLAHAEVRFDTERKERELALRNAQLAEERAIRNKRSAQRNWLIGSTGLLLLLGFFGYRNLRHRQRLALQEKELTERKVEEILRSQELRLVSAMVEGQEKERERVSKDLHDRLGSMLSSIKLQFSTLEAKITDLKTEQRSIYQKVLAMLDNAVGEVRRISRDMVSSSLSRFGLAAALTDLRESISVQDKFDVELSMFGLEERLDSNLEITAYRIVQELVSNALKHAGATELSMALTRHTDELSIVVADNGQGFDTSMPRTGMGLNNVRDRARALGGIVQVDSSAGQGTTVAVSLPIKPTQ